MRIEGEAIAWHLIPAKNRKKKKKKNPIKELFSTKLLKMLY